MNIQAFAKALTAAGLGGLPIAFGSDGVIQYSPGVTAAQRAAAEAVLASYDDTAPVVPDAIPALDGLLALDAAGLSAEYEAWANDPARSFAERAFIAKAQTWRRDDLTLNAAAADLGLTAEQVDALFIEASAS